MTSSTNQPMSESIQSSLHLSSSSPVKEPGHPCAGEGRCCGGCKNPKRPLDASPEPNKQIATTPVGEDSGR